MPRNYKRKCPDRNICTEKQINAAKKLIEEGKSKRNAAAIVGISESTLRKRLKSNLIAISLGRYKPTFTPTQEMEIYNNCNATGKMFSDLTLLKLRKIVFKYAEVNKIENRFNKTTRLAGKDWAYEFLKRHPTLVLKKTRHTTARAMGVTSNKSEIITPSKLEGKRGNENRKPKKKTTKNNAKSFKKTMVKKVNKKNNLGYSSLKKSLKQSKELDCFFCPLCTEKYEGSSREEWIECNLCKSWWLRKWTIQV